MAQQAARLGALELGLLVPLNEVRYEFNVPIGTSHLSEALYRPIFAALARAPLSISELLALPEVAATTASAVELAGMLVGTHQVLRCARALDPATRQQAVRFNTKVAREAVADGDNYAALTAPAAGSGVYLTPIQTHVYARLAAGAESSPATLAAAIAPDLERRGALLAADGKPFESDEAAHTALQLEIGATLEHWVPRWRQLGAL